MKRALKIDGFAVEVIPSTRRGAIWWTAWLMERPDAKVEARGHAEAITALQTRWNEIKAVYREANLPVPKPPRRRGNKRVLDQIRALGERKGSGNL